MTSGPQGMRVLRQGTGPRIIKPALLEMHQQCAVHDKWTSHLQESTPGSLLQVNPMLKPLPCRGELPEESQGTHEASSIHPSPHHRMAVGICFMGKYSQTVTKQRRWEVLLGCSLPISLPPPSVSKSQTNKSPACLNLLGTSAK